MTKIKAKKVSLKKVLFEYGLHIWVLLFLVNIVIFYVVQYHANGQTCLSKAQVSSDTRCLYILSNKIYEKGSRGSPHQGHPCGSDVTSVVPSSHTSGATTYLDPNYVGDICSATATNTTTNTTNTTTSPAPATSPAPIATKVPSPSPTVTVVPSPQCLGASCISPGASIAASPSPIIPNLSLTPSSGSTSNATSILTLLLLFLKALIGMFGFH
ncbi:MAG: hypothetical protein ACR2LN_06960 [Candidatus Levyibacteriota bacterium]